MCSTINKQLPAIIAIILLSSYTVFAHRARPEKILKWKNATVPYQLSYSFTSEEASVIQKAFEEISLKTCVKFVPVLNETDFVRIQKGPGCNSALGRIGGPQVINLQVGSSYRRSYVNCVQHGLVAYQLMQTLGFYPEHLRPDRDDYVTILWRNVKYSMWKSFDKHQTALYNIRTLPYDYDSVTHGGLFRFSINQEITIMPNRYGVSIGQRDGLSDGDLQKIRQVYKCVNCASNQNTVSFVVLLSFTLINAIHKQIY